MKWALRVAHGEHKDKVIPIPTSPFVIGRNPDCQLKTSNPYVSQHHCELQTSGNKFLVRDCRSTNGTFVNGQRVEGLVELEPGDRLKITSLAFVVCQIGHQADEPQESGVSSQESGVRNQGSGIRSQESARQPKHGSPNPRRPVDEDAVGDMLLELDKEEGERPGADAWRNTNSGTPDGKPAQNLPHNAEKTDPDNEPSQTPADVASEMLRGKGSLLRRRS